MGGANPAPESRTWNSTQPFWLRAARQTEPDVVEEKIYGRGVGSMLEITVSGGSDRSELVEFRGGG